MVFIKLREGDKRFGPVVMAAKNRLKREKERIVLLEGQRLISDAIRSDVKVKGLYFTRLEHLEGLPLDQCMHVPLYKVMQSHMKIWSDVSAPPGIMALCEMPKPGELLVDTDHLLPITIILDNIRDPGNMGAILRSAAAAGCCKVLATKGCVDIWEPKVLRSASAAHFKLHVINNLEWQLIGNYLTDDTHIYLADSSGRIADTPERKPSKQLMSEITKNISDVYTAIDEESGEGLRVDESYLDEKHVKSFKEFPLHTSNCYDVDFTKGETVLVIGGETAGLSAGAHKLAFEKNGEKIYIPMLDCIESLNASIASSVLMFEIQRQYLMMQREQEKGVTSDSIPHS